MSQTSKERDLTRGSLIGHFRAIAIPAALGVFFNTMYNVVDTYYAGMVSTDAQAGLTVSFSVFFILIAFGIGFGHGINALVGNALGADNRPAAQRLAAQGLIVTSLLSLILLIIGWFAMPWLLRVLGAKGAYYEVALDYLRVLVLVAPGFLLAFACNGVLVAQGNSATFQRAIMTAFVANIFLNPLLIFGYGPVPAMGYQGIAVSTLIIQFVVMAYMFRECFRSSVFNHCRLGLFKPGIEGFISVAGQGFPASVNMLTVSFGVFSIQYFIQPFGVEAVAAYGIALRVEQLVLLPGLGLSMSLLPVVAQCYGAGDYDRVRTAYYVCVILGVSLMTVGLVVLLIMRQFMMQVFTQDDAVIAIGKQYLTMAAFMLPAYFVLFMTMSFFQGLKRPAWTLVIGLYRQLLGIWGFCSLFIFVMQWGTWGLWWGIFCSVWSGYVDSTVTRCLDCSRKIRWIHNTSIRRAGRNTGLNITD